MLIVLDTSVIIGEMYLRSSRALTSIRAAKLNGLTICIPEIVIDEVLNNHANSLTDKSQSFEKIRKEMKRLWEFDIASSVRYWPRPPR